MKTLKKIVAVGLLSSVSFSANAAIEIADFDVGSTLLNFDNLADGTVLTNQFAGIDISGTSLNNGFGSALDVLVYSSSGSNSSPNYIGMPQNDWDGSIVFAFDNSLSITQFGGMSVDSLGVSLNVFDRGGNLIESVAGDGQVYDFLGVDSGTTEIGYAVFSGDFYAVDDVRFNAALPVPEPSTYALMLGGLGLVGFMARRRKQQA